MKAKTIQIVWHSKEPVWTLDFHPSGLLATGGADKEIKVYETSLTEMHFLNLCCPDSQATSNSTSEWAKADKFAMCMQLWEVRTGDHEAHARFSFFDYMMQALLMHQGRLCFTTLRPAGETR